MKSTYFFILLLFASALGYSQSNRIEWSQDYRLEKSDFLAVAPNTHDLQTVNGHYSVEYKLAGVKLIFAKNFNQNVSCVFYKNASWLDEGIGSEILLRYAQARFDLAEVAARKIRKGFADQKGKLLSGKAQEIYDNVMAEMALIESDYSKETEFARIEAAQMLWETKINRMLDDLSDFCKNCKWKTKPRGGKS